MLLFGIVWYIVREYLMNLISFYVSVCPAGCIADEESEIVGYWVQMMICSMLDRCDVKTNAN